MKATTKREEEDLRDRAVANLRKRIKPGKRVYTMVTHVTRSGMTRLVRLFIVEKGKIEDITGWVAQAIGARRAKGAEWDIVVGGCGFDAGFHVVGSLQRALFPNGVPIAKADPAVRETLARQGETITKSYGLAHSNL